MPTTKQTKWAFRLDSQHAAPSGDVSVIVNGAPVTVDGHGIYVQWPCRQTLQYGLATVPPGPVYIRCGALEINAPTGVLDQTATVTLAGEPVSGLLQHISIEWRHDNVPDVRIKFSVVR